MIVLISRYNVRNLNVCPQAHCCLCMSLRAVSASGRGRIRPRFSARSVEVDPRLLVDSQPGFPQKAAKAVASSRSGGDHGLHPLRCGGLPHNPALMNEKPRIH